MLVLALETSSKFGSVALVREGQVLAFEEYDEANAHAERLLPLVESVLRGANCTKSELSRIAVGTGPGNFTGLRVGIALAHGLGMGLEIPVVGVGSLTALASRADGSALDAVLVLRDARKQEFFAAAFDGALSPLLAPHLVQQADAREWVKTVVALHVKPGGGWTVVGDGLSGLDRAELAHAGARLTEHGEMLRPDARQVGILGEQCEASDWPLPEYIRDVDAVLPTLCKNPALVSPSEPSPTFLPGSGVEPGPTHRENNG